MIDITAQSGGVLGQASASSSPLAGQAMAREGPGSSQGMGADVSMHGGDGSVGRSAGMAAGRSDSCRDVEMAITGR